MSFLILIIWVLLSGVIISYAMMIKETTGDKLAKIAETKRWFMLSSWIFLVIHFLISMNFLPTVEAMTNYFILLIANTQTFFESLGQ